MVLAFGYKIWVFIYYSTLPNNINKYQSKECFLFFFLSPVGLEHNFTTTNKRISITTKNVHVIFGHFFNTRCKKNTHFLSIIAFQNNPSLQKKLSISNIIRNVNAPLSSHRFLLRSPNPSLLMIPPDYRHSSLHGTVLSTRRSLGAL